MGFILSKLAHEPKIYNTDIENTIKISHYEQPSISVNNNILDLEKGNLDELNKLNKQLGDHLINIIKNSDKKYKEENGHHMSYSEMRERFG